MMLFVFLGYLSGVIATLAILVYELYKDWYGGEPITLGDALGTFFISLLSWIAVLIIVINALNENSDMVIIKGREDN